MAELSTIGMSLAWGVETTLGTKPATFTKFPYAITMPERNLEPQAIDVTPLSETTSHRFVPGLANDSSPIGIQFNMNDTAQTAWEAMVSAYAGLSGGKAMWFEFYHPDLTDGFFFTGEPVALGFGGADVDSALNVTGYIVPNVIKKWDTAVSPT